MFGYTKAEMIHHQQTGTLRNVKESPSGRRKISSVGNINLHKEWSLGRITTWTTM